MFSDHIITLAGKTIIITSHDVLLSCVSIVFGLIFWALVYFSRKRIVIVKRSSGTDQLTFELSRIADALERIANRRADRTIAAAMRGQHQTQTPMRRESTGIPYSMLGR